VVETDLDAVLQRYALGQLKRSRRVEQGFVNENWVLETSRGRFFLKRRHPRLRRRRLVRAQHELITRLRNSGFPAPAIVPTTAGSTFLVLKGELYEIQVYIDGQPYQHQRLAHLEEAALTLARYHNLVRGFASPALYRLGDLYTPDMLSDILNRLARTWRLDGDPLSAEAQRQLEAHASDLSPCFAAHGSLPELVIHGDYYADNLLFEGDRIVGVVDYDKACWQPRVVELAEALIYFASPRSKELEHLVYPGVLQWQPLQRFLESYTSASALGDDEIEALPDYIRCIWLQVSLQQLLEKGPGPVEAPQALQEVLALGEWGASNAERMVEACHAPRSA
jgi:homoserine kinase type II